jgi:hypothetical protein
MKAGFFLQDTDGRFWGVENYGKLKEAPLHQRIAAFFSKKYKKRFAQLMPFETLEEVPDEAKSKLPAFFEEKDDDDDDSVVPDDFVY